MTTESILIIALFVSIIVFCCFVAVGNLLRRRRQPKKPVLPLENLELLKKQGMVTEEEFESIKDGLAQPQGLTVESCFVSSEEIMEIIDVALRTVSELGSSYIGNVEWARALGVEEDLNMDLKELTLLSMKTVKPRKAIDLIAEVLAMRISVDLPTQAKQGEVGIASPNYNAAARMLWVQARKKLSEPISIQKELCERSKIPERMLLNKLLSITMKSLDIPVSAVGFAAILALMVAKIDFNAFSDEDEEDE
ncbi:hypothetical protein ACFL6S_08890 [Candidatus Poribacteria bacterium]